MVTAGRSSEWSSDGDAPFDFGLGSARRCEGLLVGRSKVQVPMIAVHLAHHVGAATVKHVVEVLDLLLPATVRTLLFLGEQKVLATVEDAVWGRSSLDVVGRVGIVVGEAVLGSNVKHALKTEKKSGGSTGLENDLVRKDKHARLGEEVSVHVVRLEDRQNLAVDHVKHGNPGVSWNSL